MLEYRLTWLASSNITFHGATDWQEWDDEDASPAEIEDVLYRGKVECEGLLEALEASGFEWTVEIRDASSERSR